MKVNFVVVQKVGEKFWATARSEDSMLNFAPVFEGIRSLDCLHFTKSRKAAEEIAKDWNESYERNGTLMTWDEIGRYSMARII